MNYDLNLNAVAKIPLNLKDTCIGYDLEDFGRATKWGRWTGNFVRVLDWIIIVIASILLILAIVFIGSLVSPVLAQREKTKVQLARVYVLFSFILALIAILGSALYYFVFRHYLTRYADSLNSFKTEACITDPKGVNVAIENLHNYEKGIISEYGTLVSWWFWSALVYYVLWVVINKVLK